MDKKENQKYLSVPKKMAYGAGDFGGNFFYMFVSSFVLLYMTNAMGLNSGIVGTLMLVSKLLDGVSDVIFGNLIDKTHSKMGKARPWMFYSAFPLAICMIALFAIPTSMGSTAQYAWFFVFYTLCNAGFYTSMSIAYTTLIALITPNHVERVSLGSYRYVFAVVSSTAVSGATSIIVAAFGGDAAAWRTVSIIYAVIMIVFNSIAALANKEVVTEEETAKAAAAPVQEEKKSFWELLKIVITNKYYLLMIVIYLCFYAAQNLGTSVGVYYCQYILGNASLMGVVGVSAFVMIIGLAANPKLVKKYGMYKVNLVSYILNCVCSVGVLIFAYMGNLIGLVVFMCLKNLTMGPLMGSLSALVANVAHNAYLKHHVHAEGMMFSCSSVGIKLGGGLGTAIAGWLLAFGGFVGTAEVQTAGALNMIKFCYGGLPLILAVITVIALSGMKVDQDNEKLEAEA